MKSPIDNYDAEQARLERLIGLADDLAAVQQKVCADCGQPFAVTDLFWTPRGNRCRACYQAKYGELR